MLPASVGDALWIEYGARDRPRRILVDGGTSGTWSAALEAKLDALGPADRVELLVVTHVDSDHIGGVLPLFRSPHATRFRRIWFNAWRHLEPQPVDLLGPAQGEKLTTLIDASGVTWNRGFAGPDHAAKRPTTGTLPTRKLPGGMCLTVIAPGREQLDLLKPVWKKAVGDAGLVKGVGPSPPSDPPAGAAALDLLGDPVTEWADYDPSDVDTTAANGSSIAIFVEFEEAGVTRTALLTGDAHGPVLVDGIRRLAQQRGEERLRVDVVKAPHHGSVRNVTKDLVKALDGRTWLFSSNGVQHEHPHREAVARVVTGATRPTSLKFNYRTAFNEIWDVAARKQKFRYDTEHGDGSLTTKLL